MAEALLMTGGAGGVTSDDVTASRAQVLRGYTALTRDSDDEVVEGTIKVINTGANNYKGNLSTNFGIDDWNNNTFWMDFPHGNGYYYRDDGIPHCCIEAEKLGDAKAEHLLQGVSATSKNGVKFNGNIPVRGNRGPDSGECWLYPQQGGYVVRIEDGYYQYYAQFKPYVIVPTALVKQAVNYHPEKTLTDTITCAEQGQVKMIDTGLDNYKSNKQESSYGVDFGKKTFWIDLAHGNAYYFRGDGAPHVCIDADKLGNAGADSLLEGMSATSEKGVKFWGAVKRWICTTGDVITALGSEFRAWDDAFAGRGRGIIVRIPNNHYIQGANWVFISVPDLHSGNLREGTRIGDVVGTMPDYRIGRPVFESATFNTMYVGGVADKDFPQARIMRDRTYKSTIQNYVRYTGIKDGGLCIELNVGGSSELYMGSDYVGFVLDRAILMSFFRRVKITYKLDLYMYTGSYQRRAGIKVGAGLYNAANKVGIRGATASHDSPDHIGNVHDTSTHELIINAADVNGDAFLSLYANAYSDFNQSYARGKIIFTKIELVN